MKLQVTLADCGRWFDDFVIQRDGTLVDIQARAEQFQPSILREITKQVRDTREVSPGEAALLLDLADVYLRGLEGGTQCRTDSPRKKSTRSSKKTSKIGGGGGDARKTHGS